MKKLLLLSFATLSLLSSKAQTASTIYLENFDEASTGTVLTLPTGWTTNGWEMSSSNAATGYTGASGVNSVKIDNQDVATGIYSLTTKSIATTGYSSITVSWGARLTTNFPPSTITPSLFFSVDNGTTWTGVAYTEASSASAWKLNGPVSMPAAANNQASVMFQLVANITAGANGTYRIDDFLVQGVASATTGIKANSAPQQLESYVADKTLFVKMKSQNTISSLKVYEITGKEVLSKTALNDAESEISLSEFTNGIYVVKFILSNGQSVTKKIVLY